MPSYPRNAFTLEEAHAAATAAGFKPSRLGNQGRFSFNSRACHVGGDNPNGCWATEKDGRVYFHCHRHKDGKAAWMGAQHRITANLGLPEYRLPEAVAANRPHQAREWTYHNPRTGESAVQVVERYDGACWREDCGDRFAHKHPWLRRDEKFQQQPTEGFLLLEHQPQALKTPENAPCISLVNGKPCNVCNRCNDAAVRDRRQNGDGTGNWGVIAEGETTAEAAAACGWRAFSYQGGSNGAGRADYSPAAGMNILIAPDHDRPGAKAALTAAIRCIEAGAREVRVMPTDAFSRRGEDLADLGVEQRVLVIEDGWFAPLRELGPLILELAAHNLGDRCIAATQRPLVAATKQEHFDDHVGQVWAGIFQREENLGQPSLYVRDGKLMYLATGNEGDLEIIEHTGDSIAILAAASVFWYLGYQQSVLVSEPESDADLEEWQAAAAVLDSVAGPEHGWLTREVKERRDDPGQVNHVLHAPKRHHPQRTVTSALLINLPDDLPSLDAVITHPFLNGRGDRLVTEEGYHPEERVYLQNRHPFSPVPIQQAIAELDDLFHDFPFASPAADRTNLYATIVTRISRRSYDIAPMFLFDKPKSGTGATLLANLVAVLTTGKKSERVTYCNGEMLEFEKRVAATCRAASGVVLLDNLSGVMASAMLAELLTADDSFTARDLGTSRNLTFNPRNFVIVGTANNVTMTAELANRTLPVRLNAGVERPDQRTGFRHPDVKDYLVDNLPRLRNCALSLVHHWLEQGKPPASELPQGLRRYPAWQRQTAAILEAAGLTDFAGNTVEFEDRAITDAEAAQRPFVQWWWDTHQSNPVMAKDLALVALGDPNDDDSEGMLKVKGANDKQRRANLTKLIKTWLDQTYELESVTVRIVAGPLYANRYPTWILQVADASVGAFPLLPPEPEEPLQRLQSLQRLQTLQGLGTPVQNAVADSGRKRTCSRCGHRLLPDEAGPECEDCTSGRRDPLEVRRMLTGEDTPTEVQP